MVLWTIPGCVKPFSLKPQSGTVAMTGKYKVFFFKKLS